MKQQLYFFDVILFVIVAVATAVVAPRTTQFYIGMALAAVALVFWIAARVQLGESFAIGPKAHKLVTTGLYSRLRNPVYFFANIAYLGLAIVWNTIPAYVIVAAVWWGQTRRAKREADVLEKAFGVEYRRYREQTWF